jgi:hypothetical protein
VQATLESWATLARVRLIVLEFNELSPPVIKTHP